MVNIVAIGMIAVSLFYLDTYRNRLLDERFRAARGEATVAAAALAQASPPQRRALLAAIGTSQRTRLRLYDSRGQLELDSFRLAPPSFTIDDPRKDRWLKRTARLLDRIMDWVLGARRILSYRENGDAADWWPEIGDARVSGHAELRQRYAPDRTPVITVAVPFGTSGETLLTLRNEPDVTQNVRDARQSIAIAVAMALLVSVQLSLFLARTIVQPLRMLVRAAVRVRLGRERAVVVPRLPERRDEIGLLARAISDMTAALRRRIDAVESFAADVAHEIKNPLASLRSALESLDKVEDPDLRRQLTAIAAHDVRRIDRLITEISDASRIDAELSRTAFVPVDMRTLVWGLVEARERRGANAGRRVRLQAGPPTSVPALVAGDDARLERVFENLLDNAVSFTPPGGAIGLVLSVEGGRIVIEVLDEGPGIAPEARERVFERFHSLRPAGEDFGSHSGLGLAIARTIVEAHDGTLTAREPVAPADPARPGARLVIDLPMFHPGADLL